MPEEKYAFISYSHKDNKIILPIIKELSLVVNVWYDDGIHAGSEWEEIIASRIINCTCFLYFVSKNSIESVNCKNEIHLANKKNKKFICIFIEDIKQLPGFLELIGSRIQGVFYYENSTPEALIDKIFIEDLKCLRKTEIEIEHEKERIKKEEKEKKKQKIKKTIKAVGISLGVVACATAALFGSIAILNNRQEKAINYIEKKDYKSALKLFKTFKDYGETSKLITLCDAGQSFDNNDYITGLTNISNINGTYDFEVDLNGGTYIEDTSIKFLGIKGQKNDYEFINWNIEDYSIDARNYQVHLKFIAEYEEIKYSITYILDGGELTDTAPRYYTTQQEIVLPIPTKTGYKFDGWTIGSDINCVDKIEKGSTGDITLTAHWSLSYFMLTVSSNNVEYGTVTGGGNFLYNSQCTIVATCSGAAYKFDGWYLKGNLVSTDLTYTFNMPAENVEYVANFSLNNIPKPNVTFTNFTRSTKKTVNGSTDLMNPSTPYIDQINFKTLGGYSAEELRSYGFVKLTLSLSLKCFKTKYGFLSYKFSYNSSGTKYVNVDLKYSDSGFLTSYAAIDNVDASCTIEVLLSEVTSTNSFYLIWDTVCNPSNGGSSSTSNVEVAIAIE